MSTIQDKKAWLKEAWLHANKKAKASVMRGIGQAKKGNFTDTQDGVPLEEWLEKEVLTAGKHKRGMSFKDYVKAHITSKDTDNQ